MAAGRIKGITIEIGGDTTKLTKALASVDNAISKTQQNLRDINRALKLDPTNVTLLKDRQEELTKEIENTETRIYKEREAYEALRAKLNEPMSLDQVEEFNKMDKEAEALKLQIDLDTAALKNLKEEAKSAGSVMGTVFQEYGQKMQEVGDKIKSAGDSIKNVGSTLTQKVTVPIAAAFGGSIKSAIDWESAFTGVMKTVDETANTTYDDLKDAINEIAKTTASSQNEIAATMEIAGQLGVSADDIAEFTKVMVELGDTTNLSSEEAASAIAKFANVTKMPLADVENLGSVIVDLGNNYATTEADIMSMATRLSGAGAQIGLTQGEILGFATALSSVGIEAEMGGSAFSKAMIKMQVAAETGYDQVIDLQNKTGMSLRELELLSANNSKDFRELADSLGLTKDEMNATIKAGTNLQDFAEVANMSTEQFVNLYRTDAPAALQAFIQGLGDTEGQGESTIAMLQEMGFTEVRLRDTLTRLAQSGDLVTDAVAKGNEAWTENSAMSTEAELRYATMEAKISQLKARLVELAVEIGEKLMPYVEKAMDFIDQLIQKWNALDPAQQEMILKIAAIAAAIGPVLVIVGTVISSIGTIVSAIGSVTSALGSVMSAVSALGGPITIIIAAVGALVAAFIYFYNTNEEFREKVNAVIENVKEAFSGFVENIKVWFGQVKEWLAPIIDAIKTFLSGLAEFVKVIIDSIKEDISKHQHEIDAIMTTIKTIISVSFEVMKTKVQVTLEIIRGVVTTVLNVLGNLFKAATALIKGDWSGAWEYLKAAALAGINGIETMFNNLKKILANALENIIDSMRNWGKDMMDNLIDGIKSKIDSIRDTVSDVAEVIFDFLHFTEPDVGPLKNFHTFMPDMMKEMVKGIDAGLPMLESATDRIAGALVPNVANGTNTTNNNSVNITVYGAKGQSVDDLGNVIMDRINAQIYSGGAVFA